jgi:hypothetical protein
MSFFLVLLRLIKPLTAFGRQDIFTALSEHFFHGDISAISYHSEPLAKVIIPVQAGIYICVNSSYKPTGYRLGAKDGDTIQGFCKIITLYKGGVHEQT